MNIKKERAKEILENLNKGGDIQEITEYKDFVNENIYFNVSMEITYILNQGFESRDAPFTIDDIENIKDRDEAIDKILEYFDDIDNDENEVKESLELLDIDLDDIDKNTTINKYLKDYLSELSTEDILGYIDDLGIDLENREPYEWWAVSDRMIRYLEDNNGIYIAGTNYWGRTTTGQAIKLDYLMKKFFKDYLKNIIERW